jgi:hypothetical protein
MERAAEPEATSSGHDSLDVLRSLAGTINTLTQHNARLLARIEALEAATHCNPPVSHPDHTCDLNLKGPLSPQCPFLTGDPPGHVLLLMTGAIIVLLLVTFARPAPQRVVCC